MPIEIKMVNRALTLTWTNEDQTTEASWKIRPDLQETEKLAVLRRALTFMESQLGIVSTPVIMSRAPGSTSPTAPATGATTDAPREAPQGLLLPTMSPAQLSDRPSDGGPPVGSMSQKFWEGMPTTVTPDLAAPGRGGWEMMPPEEGGAW